MVDPATMREGRSLDGGMRWEGKIDYTEEKIREVNAYRVLNPVPTEDYQPWPVAIGLLQQPFVRFADDKERDAYMAKLDEQEKKLDAVIPDCTSVRAADAPSFDRLIHATHKAAAKDYCRPAKEGDKEFDTELDYVVQQAGSPWPVWCKRQIVDGEGGIGWIIECWIYFPGRDYPHINRWIVWYNGPQ